MGAAEMSDGANEGLFRLAEQAAPDPNRLMPAERKYVKTSQTMDLQEAMAHMKRRKNKSEPAIPGGLDDPKASLKQAPEPPNNTRNNTPDDPFAGFVGPADFLPVSAGDAEKKASRRLSAQGVKTILAALALLAKEIKAIKEKLQGNKPDSQPQEEEKTDLLARFKQEKHRATFQLNGMAFTVTCLGMIRDAVSHTLVLPFTSDTEAFFTPPNQSELQLSYDGRQVGGKLFYFGMCFTVPELGIKFLGFLYDDSQTTQTTQTAQIGG